MSWVVVVWTMSFDDQFAYEDGLIGPYRSERKAERKAAAIRKAIDKTPWDEERDKPDGVEVKELIRGTVAARDAVLAHLVQDL